MVKVTPLAMVDDLLAVAPCGIESVAVNVFINTQIEMKKLEFHTQDKFGKSKCHKMHVGKENMLCPDLKVHGTEMGLVKHDTYLGDIISSDGSNSKNVKSRVGKGLGIISEIINILETVSFGKYYFQIAMTLRESMFLNGILTNCEVWYNLKKSEIEDLEELDRMLLRKIFNTQITCPKEALYLESGAVPISVIVKSRRLNYLHYLVKEDEETMLSKFFYAQWNSEVKNDWTCQVRLDLADFCLPEDLDFIKSKSEYSFKRIVKVKAMEYSISELNAMKGSKMENTFHSKLEIQSYLKLQKITPDDAKLIFSYRSRMAKFSENFRGPAGPKLCPLCLTHLDNQQMSFSCPKIKPNLNTKGKYETLFRSEIPLETIENLRMISKIRAENIKE